MHLHTADPPASLNPGAGCNTSWLPAEDGGAAEEPAAPAIGINGVAAAKSGTSHPGRNEGTHAGHKRSPVALEGAENGVGAQPGEQGKRRRYEGRDAAGQRLCDTNDML